MRAGRRKVVANVEILTLTIGLILLAVSCGSGPDADGGKGLKGYVRYGTRAYAEPNLLAARTDSVSEGQVVSVQSHRAGWFRVQAGLDTTTCWLDSNQVSMRPIPKHDTAFLPSAGGNVARPMMYVGDDGAVVRSKPRADAPSIETLSMGARVDIIEERGKWVRIYSSDTTAIRWVTKRSLVAPSDYENRAFSALKLLGWSWHEEYGYAIAEGRVKNVSGKRLQYVKVIVSFETSNGDFITSDDSYLEYTTLMPGQTSPWKVMARSNPLMSRAKVEFESSDGSSLPYYTAK